MSLLGDENEIELPEIFVDLDAEPEVQFKSPGKRSQSVSPGKVSKKKKGSLMSQEQSRGLPERKYVVSSSGSSQSSPGENKSGLN